MNKFWRYILILLFILLLPIITYFFIESPQAALETPQEKVLYNLPYPGILPDHPLYFIKIVRDNLVDFLTRDNLKKAQLYLLYSDKRVAMALSLAKKGKDQPAIDTFSKGEKYFLKIIPLLKSAKTQGAQAPSNFIETLKLSNAKHHELIQELMKTLPQGLNEQLSQLLKLNDQVRREIK
jgi:hypothetical protein